MTILILPLVAAVGGVLGRTTEGTANELRRTGASAREITRVRWYNPIRGCGRRGLAAGAALSAVVAQIACACADAVSLMDFSLIVRCFSSSLARICTKLPGMGLFN